jgi:AraC-like DNA-binding protein
VVADPNPHVILHRSVDGRTRAAVVGARSRWVDVDQRPRSWTVGVRLAVGGLTRLTRLPASELTDRSVRLDDVFGADGRAVTRRLEEVAEPAGAADLLLDFVGCRVGDGGDPDWRVRGLMATLAAAPATTVGAAGRRLGVSTRALRDAVREHVGLAPKVVQRVHRLLRALSAMRAGAAGNDVPAALSVGYADHAHFVHECQSLLGETPRRFLDRGRTGRSAPIPTSGGRPRALG